MNLKKNDEKENLLARGEEARKEKLVQAITEDFYRRREARRSLESGWLLNLNFLSGNQYCDVSPQGGIEEEEKRYFWQARRVFNHIAPTVDSRIAKLEKLKPELRVKPFSDEERDVKAAGLATGILKYARQRTGWGDAISKATVWSESCGCAFYKVLWDEKGGRQVAVDAENAPVYEGEAQVVVVSPFEIFPDRLDAESLDEVGSLIHAQVVSTDYVMEKFGVAVKGENCEIERYSAPSSGRFYTGGRNAASIEEGVVLIEKYSRPTTKTPKGRLEIVAGGVLLYEGDLPYRNGKRGERSFPFVKQDSTPLPAAFFGSSVVDRLIPVQRAYNAVRNRKHEFLNRLSMGILTVEDGSIDTEELSEEGLLPGKILVYRQGGKAPEMLDCGNIPSEFKEEEEWLEKEFSRISGISDLSQNSTPARVTSATGLRLLLAQDEARLSATVACMERAVKEVGRQILLLYRQFAGTARLMTMTGEDKKTQAYYFNASALDAEDIQFEPCERSTGEERRVTLMELCEAGILSDENGKISRENKGKILQAFGFGEYENGRDISALHQAKASAENLILRKENVEIDCYDEDEIHIEEHTRYLLSAEFDGDKEGKGRFIAHLAEHEKAKKKKEENR